MFLRDVGAPGQERELSELFLGHHACQTHVGSGGRIVGDPVEPCHRGVCKALADCQGPRGLTKNLLGLVDQRADRVECQGALFQSGLGAVGRERCRSTGIDRVFVGAISFDDGRVALHDR